MIVSKLRETKLDKRKKKRKPKPYRRADDPGQKIQINVKYVPSCGVTDGRKYYRYKSVEIQPVDIPGDV